MRTLLALVTLWGAVTGQLVVLAKYNGPLYGQIWEEEKQKLLADDKIYDPPRLAKNVFFDFIPTLRLNRLVRQQQQLNPANPGLSPVNPGISGNPVINNMCEMKPEILVRFS